MKHLTVAGWLVVVGLYLYSTLPLLPSTNAQPSGSFDPLTNLPDLSAVSRKALRRSIRSANKDNSSPRRFMFALWHVFRAELTSGGDLPTVADSLVEMMAQLDCIFINASGSGFDPNSGEDREVLSSALVQLATQWNANFGSSGPLIGFHSNRLYYAHEMQLLNMMSRVEHEFTAQRTTNGQALWNKLMLEIYTRYRGLNQGQRTRYLMKVEDNRSGRMPRRVFAQAVALLSVGRLMPDPEKGELKRRYDTWLSPPDPQWDTWFGLRRAQLWAKLDRILYDT